MSSRSNSDASSRKTTLRIERHSDEELADGDKSPQCYSQSSQSIQRLYDGDETPPALNNPQRGPRLTRKGRELTKLLLFSLDCLDVTTVQPHNSEAKFVDLDSTVPLVGLHTMTSRSGDTLL